MGPYVEWAKLIKDTSTVMNDNDTMHKKDPCQRRRKEIYFGGQSFNHFRA